MTDRKSPNADPSSAPTPPPAGPVLPWWRNRWIVAAIVAVLILLGLIIWRLASVPSGHNDTAATAVPVLVAPARAGTFVVEQSALGTVTPLRSVTVHSRVDGRLTRLAFKQGQMVKKGQLLAQIDPRPFRIQLQLAQGEFKRDDAVLDNAQATLKSYQSLFAQDSIGRQKLDDQTALVRKYSASVNIDQARVAQATLQLSYTRIESPITGLAGLRRVDVGNVVSATDHDGIVVVTQLQPTSVVFALPASALPELRQAMQASTSIDVVAYGQDPRQVLAKGTLSAMNNQIDPATGTIKLEARFANADGVLFPNQFVNVRLPIAHLADAILVPTSAVQHGSNGTFVYRVKADHTVAVVPVTIGAGDADTTVIKHGVEAGEHVVAGGTDRLRDGTLITPIPDSTAATAAPAGARSSAAPQPVGQSSGLLPQTRHPASASTRP